MKIFVCIKQVPDTESKIVPSGTGIDEAAVEKWILNPYDEFAVEEAVKLKEETGGSEVVALSLGPERVKEVFQTALAMGADRGIHIASDAPMDPAQVAEALASAIKSDGTPKVVFMGTLAIDDCANQVHLRLARHLEAAAAINVSSFSWKGDGAEVVSEAGGGSRNRLFIAAPAVVAVTRGINKPRYPTLPNIMKAKKKEVRRVELNELGTEIGPSSLEITSMQAPEEFTGGTVLEGESGEAVSELAERLRNEARVV